jgi:phosphoribosylamine-glycine ligase
MATTNGVKLIEYNARFGDPESLNALPLLETDAIDVLNLLYIKN